MNATLSGVWAIIAGATSISWDQANRLYMRLVGVALMCLALIFVQWLINISGLKGVNLIIFFTVGFLLLAMGFAPIGLSIGAATGTVYGFLKDEDLTQSAAKGLRSWFKAVLIAVFVFWVISGGLSFWSFRWSPFAFWPIAAGACLIIAATLVFGVKRSITRYLVIAAAVMVILSSLWSTLSPADKALFTSSGHPNEPKALGIAQWVTAPPKGEWANFGVRPGSCMVPWSPEPFTLEVNQGAWESHTSGDAKAGSFRLQSKTGTPVQVRLDWRNYGQCG